MSAVECEGRDASMNMHLRVVAGINEELSTLPDSFSLSGWERISGSRRRKEGRRQIFIMEKRVLVVLLRKNGVPA